MVSSRAAIHPHGRGNGAAPLVRQGAHRVRGGGVSDEKKYTAKFRKTPLPQAFFQLYDEEDAEWGVRPGSVTDPVPQERV